LFLIQGDDIISLLASLLVEITGFFVIFVSLCISQSVSVTGFPSQIISVSNPALNLAGVHISSAFDIVLKDPQHCCAFH
jgi:ABC-type uncharacterized transport system permease subunit